MSFLHTKIVDSKISVHIIKTYLDKMSNVGPSMRQVMQNENKRFIKDRHHC
jgi:hypothetical protein